VTDIQDYTLFALKTMAYIFHLLGFYMSWGSSVSMVSDYGLDDRGSIPDRGFFF
jgi:hypothetical protein